MLYLTRVSSYRHRLRLRLIHRHRHRHRRAHTRSYPRTSDLTCEWPVRVCIRWREVEERLSEISSLKSEEPITLRFASSRNCESNVTFSHFDHTHMLCHNVCSDKRETGQSFLQPHATCCSCPRLNDCTTDSLHFCNYLPRAALVPGAAAGATQSPHVPSPVHSTCPVKTPTLDR